MKEIDRLLDENIKLRKELETLKLRIVHLQGWKGESGLTINQREDYYYIIEYRKPGPDEPPEEVVHIIPKENVSTLWDLFKENLSFGIIYSYRDIIRLIMNHYNLSFDINAFNGGENRAKWYFPHYYYPCKILSHYGLINYFGRGRIQRIR